MFSTESIKRVVIKIGTSTLTHSTGRLDLRHLETLARVLSDIKNMGTDVVLVTSGAIGVGMSKLGMTVRPSELRYKQAAAAVGQCELMHIYDKFFLDYSQVVGQILITKSDIALAERRQKVEDTFETLFELGAIPVVNENDTTGVDEILFGDNDTLSAEVAALVDADLLIIFSDIDGLYDKDPREYSDAKIISRVSGISDDIRALAGGAGSKLGTGGMVTKIHAAEVCFANDIPMVITNGKRIENAYDILSGNIHGTLFMK
ncbi:MAG: glutamate 5-kinase [Oscillospiraceae bacterium]|nr:glutamate 5-kinase [Oscillospiraceae bacterium]